MTPFTYYTIIGKDPSLLKGHLENVTKYAGFDKLECEKRLLVIVYRNSLITKETTDKILEVCDEYGAHPVMYDEPVTEFLPNLYACWNLGYEYALDGFVFRGGSDQVFSKDSFVSLHRVAEETKNRNIVLQANTIENGDRNLGSRHILKSFGDTFEGFKLEEFEETCEELNGSPFLPDGDLVSISEALEVWGKPTSFNSSLGHINRCDGCSWLMSKKDWEEFGPLPITENGHTGDVVIHDRLQKAGYQSYIAKDCITYHFVRGESLEVQ